MVAIPPCLKLLHQQIQKSKMITANSHHYLADTRTETSEPRSAPKSFCSALVQEHRGPVLSFQHTSVSSLITLIPADEAKIPASPLTVTAIQLDTLPCASRLPTQRLEKPTANSRRDQHKLLPEVCFSTGCREETRQMLN